MIKKLNFYKKQYKYNKRYRNKYFSFIKRNKKFYKQKATLLNFKHFLLKTSLNYFNLKINIRVRSNNIFCTLVSLKKNKILLNSSSGKCQINTSKKKLKFNTKIILNSFFNDINNYLTQSKFFIVELIAPLKTRKQIVFLLKQKINKKNLILSIKENKCFNGCRPPKKKRKKGLAFRFRIFN